LDPQINADERRYLAEGLFKLPGISWHWTQKREKNAPMEVVHPRSSAFICGSKAFCQHHSKALA
jgi:hypothetical protein